MGKRDIRCLVVFSDLHSGSRRSLMPEEYTLYEEGALNHTIKANKQQLWLLKCWKDAWRKVHEYVGNDPWAWLCLGDATEGVHRKQTELVSNDMTDHMIIFDQLVRPMIQPKKNPAKKGFMVRGTSIHVGETVEMKLGEKLGCEKHPDTGQFAADRWILNINDHTMLFRHHMEVTSREWCRNGGLERELANEQLAAIRRGQPVPDSASFAHRHMFDSICNGKNYVMVNGPWQQTTRYGHTRWSAMLPEPTVTVLDWRNKPAGAPPKEECFKYSPPAATVYEL